MNYEIQFAVWKASEETPKPDVSFVPMMERRRLTGVERAALSVAWQVKSEKDCPVVFASRWGEIGVTAKLMKQFHADKEMSPAGFSSSVHNAAPGAFSLLTKNRAPYTAIAARERSLESGMLEALTLGSEAVFVYAEEATPDLYEGEFEDVQAGCSVAIRLVPCAGCEDEDVVRVEYRHADMNAATFDGLVDFLDGKSEKFETSDFVLKKCNNPGK